MSSRADRSLLSRRGDFDSMAVAMADGFEETVASDDGPTGGSLRRSSGDVVAVVPLSASLAVGFAVNDAMLNSFIAAFVRNGCCCESLAVLSARSLSVVLSESEYIFAAVASDTFLLPLLLSPRCC